MISLILFLVSLAFGVFLYFLPAGIASMRRHSKVASIFVLNLFLGWTLLGWVVALVWAVSENNVVASREAAKPAPAYDEMF